jgi:hypothetical protein
MLQAEFYLNKRGGGCFNFQNKAPPPLFTLLSLDTRRISQEAVGKTKFSADAFLH